MKTLCLIRIVVLLALLITPAAAPAQFTFTTNNDAITITGYTGPGGNVIIPSTTNGFPIASIGNGTFFFCTNLTSVTIGNNVTGIGVSAFGGCRNLTNVLMSTNVTFIGNGAFANCGMTSIIIPNGVTSIGYETFFGSGLTSVTIPNSVTNIGEDAFQFSTNLNNVTIPKSVISIGDNAFGECYALSSVIIPSTVTSINAYAFSGCTKLTAAYFQGNAPPDNQNTFSGDGNATVYYLPGTAGWGAVFGSRPTAPWTLPYPVILDGANGNINFGVQDNQFGFTISWATNVPVVVEACSNLVNPAWIPVTTNALVAGTNYFSDADWTNYPNRYYRVRSP